VYLTRPRCISGPNVSTRISGVAQLTDGRTYILVRDEHRIAIYGPDNEFEVDIDIEPQDSNDGEPSRYLVVNMVACQDTRQLYIGEMHIHFMEVDQDTTAPGRIRIYSTDSGSFSLLQTESVFVPDALSIRNGRLLVTSSNLSDDIVFMFAHDGTELLRISSPDMKELFHAVETSRGTFVVSFHKPQCEIREVDADCNVLRRYSEDKLQCGYPIYLVIDPDDRVLVAMLRDNQVWLFRSCLELERVLLGNHCCLSEIPSRLCYVHATGQLIIGSGWYQSTGIKVFNVRYV